LAETSPASSVGGTAYKNCCNAADDARAPEENTELNGNDQLWVRQENSLLNVRYEELTEYEEISDKLSDEYYGKCMSEFEDGEEPDGMGDIKIEIKILCFACNCRIWVAKSSQ
jgi:hypothetical protein